jgi:hypothetical protein
MTFPLTITGNPNAFAGASDLTDETHDTILTVLEIETAVTVGRDFLKAALRAISRVGALARREGWDATAVMHLEAVAAQIYADIFREATLDLNSRRRMARRG